MNKNTDIVEYIECVTRDIIDLYSVNSDKAKELVTEYDFEDILKSEPNFVMHYNTEDWAELIYNKKSIKHAH